MLFGGGSSAQKCLELTIIWVIHIVYGEENNEMNERERFVVID